MKIKLSVLEKSDIKPEMLDIKDAHYERAPYDSRYAGVWHIDLKDNIKKIDSEIFLIPSNKNCKYKYFFVYNAFNWQNRYFTFSNNVSDLGYNNLKNDLMKDGISY